MKSLSMRRGIHCDLDLCLSSPFANYYHDLMSSTDTTTTSSPAGACINNFMEGQGGSSNAIAGSGSQQPLTMIFNGKVCVANVTEHQAGAILCHATTGRSERLMINSTTSPATTTPCSSSSSLPPPSPSLLLQSPITTPTTTTTTAMNMNEISMKRSLQRFLQKRKNRIQSFSSHPYNKQ